MKGTAFVLAIALSLATVPAAAWGEVNCNQVRRYAQTGRAAEDIAETMIVPIDEVKKCLQSEGQNPAPTPAAK
jgi:hypothetical protein